MAGWALLLIASGLALAWLGASAAAARRGRWAGLARDFPARHPVPGERFRNATALLGDEGAAARYGGLLSVTIGDEGIGLSAGFPDSLFCAPLFLPWRTVATVESRQSVLASEALIRLHGRDKVIRLRGSVAICALRTWARAGCPSD